MVNIPKKFNLIFPETKAILYVDSGDNLNQNVSLNEYVSKITERFHCITATLGQNPNMPIQFYVSVK